MPAKPSYEELEQRVKELEEVAAVCRQAEDALRESAVTYQITKRKRMEHELRESEAQMTAILDFK
jgi:hypothetical protein